jgi:hypothetical protein
MCCHLTMSFLLASLIGTDRWWNLVSRQYLPFPNLSLSIGGIFLVARVMEPHNSCTSPSVGPWRSTKYYIANHGVRIFVAIILIFVSIILDRALAGDFAIWFTKIPLGYMRSQTFNAGAEIHENHMDSTTNM